MAEDIWLVRRGDQWRAKVPIPEWLDPHGATFEGEIIWDAYGEGRQSLLLTVDNGRLDTSAIPIRQIRVDIEEADGAEVPLGRIGRRKIRMTKNGIVTTFDSTPVEVCDHCIPPQPEVPDMPQPNIVAILTDDQDYQTIMKSADFMPKLHQHLRQAGTYFPNAFSHFPLCTPSRATWLTGLYGHNHGVIGNRLPMGGVEKFLPQEDNTVPMWLQEHGYTTFFAGKYLNGYGLAGRAQDSRHIPPGWDDWHGQIGQAYFNISLNNNGEPTDYPAGDYQADIISGLATSFIATAAEPFYAQICPISPHSDAEYPERSADLFTDEEDFLNEPNQNEADVSDKPWHIRRLDLLTPEKVAENRVEYRNRLRSLDPVGDLVEAIVNALTTRGILGKTIIVFMPDNGVSMGGHRVRSKGALYDSVAKVGMLIRGPGIPAGATLDSMVDNVDLVATLLDFAQVTPFGIEDLQRPLDGTSFRALFADPGAPWKTQQFLECFPSGDDDEDDDDLIAVDHEQAFGIRTATRKYTEYFSKDYGRERELYDLTLDPYELVNKINVTSGEIASGYEPDVNSLAIALANRIAPIVERGARQPPLPRGLYDVLVQLGFASPEEGGSPDLMFCLDFGAKLCSDLDPETRRVLDLKADQPTHSFHRGGSGGLGNDDPTPNGEAGRMSRDEYYSFDGDDFFRLVGSENTVEVDSLHKNNALLTVAGMIWPGDLVARQGIFGTNAGDLNSVGVELTIEPTTGFLRFRATNGSGTAALEASSTSGLIAGRWNFFAVSIDEAANLSSFSVNGVQSTAAAAYTAPSAAAATHILELGALGDEALPLRSGARLAQECALTLSMSVDEREALWRRTRGRFGI